MPTALIVGAAGQDGRLLAPFLIDRGYVVHGWVHTETISEPGCECALVNVLDAASVERELHKNPPDEIYYLAAFHHSTEDLVGSSTSELLRQSFDVHVIGLLNVLQAMKAQCPKARLFYAASSHVFGKATTEWQNENTPLRPDSAYGVSKAAGVRCCQLWRNGEGLFAATGILFNHESSFRKPSFVSQKIVRGALQCRKDPTFRLTLGDLDARVDWSYAGDVVDAMFRILQLPEPSDFIVASGELHSIAEFAQLAFAEVGLDWREHVATDARIQERSRSWLRGDSGKLRSRTGWSPSVGFSELVSKLLQEVEKTL